GAGIEQVVRVKHSPCARPYSFRGEREGA
ncbi:MAG: hypothetical protein RJB25_934, partial [Bacteroidota bacterium]